MLAVHPSIPLTLLHTACIPMGADCSSGVLTTAAWPQWVQPRAVTHCLLCCGDLQVCGVRLGPTSNVPGADRPSPVPMALCSACTGKWASSSIGRLIRCVNVAMIAPGRCTRCHTVSKSVSQSGVLHGHPFTSDHQLPTSGNRGHQFHLSPLSNKGATNKPSHFQ
jgi:hypothetical protein